jgi:hypothetical protein
LSSYTNANYFPASSPRPSPRVPRSSPDFPDTASAPASSPDDDAHPSNYGDMHCHGNGDQTLHAELADPEEAATGISPFVSCAGQDCGGSESSSAPIPSSAASSTAVPATHLPPPPPTARPANFAAVFAAATAAGAGTAPIAPLQPLLSPAIAKAGSAVSAAAAADPFHDDWAFW